MGRVRLYQQDLNMMNTLNSKERTLEELGESAARGYNHLDLYSCRNEAGFKFVKLWEAGEASIVEFSTA